MSLPVSENHLIYVLCGPAASGKTYLGKAIAKATCGIHLSSDRIRLNMVNVQKLWSKKSRDKVYEELLVQLAHSLKKARSVILDATFMKKHFRLEVYKNCLNANRKLMLVECKRPAPTELIHRIRSRKYFASQSKNYEHLCISWPSILFSYVSFDLLTVEEISNYECILGWLRYSTSGGLLIRHSRDSRIIMIQIAQIQKALNASNLNS